MESGSHQLGQELPSLANFPPEEAVDVHLLLKQVAAQQSISVDDNDMEAIVGALANCGISEVPAFGELSQKGLNATILGLAESPSVECRTLLRATWSHIHNGRDNPWYLGSEKSLAQWSNGSMGAPDIYVVVGGEELPCHAHVLRQASEVLRAEIDMATLEDEFLRVELPVDIIESPETAEAFLCYIYTGELRFRTPEEFSVEQVPELLDIVDYCRCDTGQLIQAMKAEGFVSAWSRAVANRDCMENVRAVANVNPIEVRLVLEGLCPLFTWGENWFCVLSLANVFEVAELRDACLDVFRNNLLAASSQPTLTEEFRCELSECSTSTASRYASNAAVVKSLWQLGGMIRQERHCPPEWRSEVGEAMHRMGRDDVVGAHEASPRRLIARSWWGDSTDAH